LPPGTVNCLTATFSTLPTRHARLFLSSSQAGTIRIDDTQPSTIFHPTATKPFTLLPYYPQVTICPLKRGYSNVDLRNKVVIGDALHTQRQVSIQNGKAGGNYLWTVKGNQPQLLQDLQDWFDPNVKLLPGTGCPPKDFCSATVLNKGHGRLEVRTLTTSSQLNDFLDWPFLQQVFKLERIITVSKTGKTRHEIVYGITSLSAEQASPSHLLHMLRSYWQIENSLHYPRDVTLHEDQTRFKNHSAAHNMATINNLVLALIAKSPFPFVPSARRFFAAHPDHALALLL
jgi:predicted transposase YbfD/YdcC